MRACFAVSLTGRFFHQNHTERSWCLAKSPTAAQWMAILAAVSLAPNTRTLARTPPRSSTATARIGCS